MHSVPVDAWIMIIVLGNLIPRVQNLKFTFCLYIFFSSCPLASLYQTLKIELSLADWKDYFADTSSLLHVFLLHSDELFKKV